MMLWCRLRVDGDSRTYVMCSFFAWRDDYGRGKEVGGGEYGGGGGGYGAEI